MLAWLDLACGASGDMLLGALLDAGAPPADVASCIAAVGVPVSISTSRVVKHGVAATQVSVHVSETPPPHRTWYDVKTLLDAAELPAAVRVSALGVFAVLAEAEGLAHGTAPEEVHFHEVGAHDAIADIVGVCAAFHALGVTGVTATPVALGGGTVRSAHGVLSVPVPAVEQIVALHDLAVVLGPVDVELCTPTGAALLSRWVTGWSAVAPPGEVLSIGVGSGTRDLPDRANVLRVVLTR